MALGFVGTKSEGQREDEEADRLVRPAPRHRAPRRDLRRERVEVERDPDVSADPDLSGDPDLSMNYKSIGGALRVALRFARKDPEFQRYIENKTFPSRDTGEDVQFQSLPYAQQAEIRKKFHADRENEEQAARANYKPLDEEAARAAGKALSNLAEANPSFQSVLEMVRDPSSPLGGVVQAEANRPKPLASILKGVTFPEGVKTVGDLQQALAHLPRKGVKPPKAPTGPAAPSPPPQPSSVPSQSPSTPASPPVPPGSSPSSTQSPPSSPSQAPPAQPTPAPPKPSIPPPKRPDPSPRETYEARQALLATFPPDVAVQFFTAHPEDVRRLLSTHRAFQEHGIASSKNLAGSIDDVKRVGFTTDFEKIKPPAKGKAADGKVVPFDSLSDEEKSEALQQHRIETVALGLAVRGALTSAMSRRGAPKEVAAAVADLCLTAPSDAKKRQRAVHEAAEKVFFGTIEQPSKGDEDLEQQGGRDRAEEEDRFQVPQAAPTDPRTPTRSRRKLLAYLDKVFPDGVSVAAARFQGEDYLSAREIYLSHGSPDRISEHDTPGDIARKVRAAVRTMRTAEVDLPPSALPPAWKIFRDRVLSHLRALDPEKHAPVEKALRGLDREQYELDRKAYEKAKAQYDEAMKNPSGYRKPSPVPPTPPVKPFDDDVDPANVLQSFRERLASCNSSYRSWSARPVIHAGSYRFDCNFPKGYPMSTQRSPQKEAKILVDETITRLDLTASSVQAKFASMGLDANVAREIVNNIDKVADQIESAFYGTVSLQKRQAQVVGDNLRREARVVQQDKDEPYMGTYNAPSAVHQQDGDEPYMGAYDDDQTEAVRSGKAENGRPLAP